jgi:thiamine kinase-like enzyme
MLKLFRIIIFILLALTPYAGASALEKTLEEKREALTRAFKTALDAPLPERFQLLPGGYSSPGIYKVDVNDKPYVIRLSHPGWKPQEEQRAMSCIKISAERKLSPKVYYASSEDGIVIMDYIDPKLLSWEELTDPNHLTMLALTVKKIHEGPKFPESISIFDVRRSFERMLGNDKPNWLDELSAELAKIEGILKEDKVDVRPCHHDLKLDNFLFDGKQFWVVDWEAACQGNSLFDLETIIIFMALNDTQEGFFLKSYFGQKPNDTQRYHLKLMKQVVLCYYGTAYLMVAKIRYQQPPFARDHSKLPDAEVFLRGQIKRPSSSMAPENIQEFGIVLLNQVFKNIKHRNEDNPLY